MADDGTIADVEGLDPAATGHGQTLRGDPARIRGALPGERLRIAVEHVGKDGIRYGRAQGVLRASGDRVDPGCPHFLACGGCDLLHASYPAQLGLKRARVAAALGLAVEAVDPTLPSPRVFGYRAFAKLVAGPGGVLGSYRPRTHDVQDMAGCRVHAPEAEGVVDAARAHLAVAPVDLRYLLVRASLDEGRAVVTLVVRDRGARGLEGLVRALSARKDVARVVVHVNPADGDALWDPEGETAVRYDEGPVQARLGPVRQALEAGAFSQVNPLAAAELYRRAVGGADAAGRRVLDLYAGSGGLSLALLAAGAARVHAVESVPAAIDAAQAAAAASGVQDRLSTEVARVEAALEDLRPEDAEVVVLNPPRKGAGGEVMRRVFALDPERVVYVSCNPDSLARDLEAAPDGWRLARVTPVDMFPHTRHVETVAVLEPGPRTAREERV